MEVIAMKFALLIIILMMKKNIIALLKIIAQINIQKKLMKKKNALKIVLKIFYIN